MKDEDEGFPPSSSRLALLSGFHYFARLDATGADPHALRAALRTLRAYGLQVGIEPARSPVVCVGDIIAELRPLAADLAAFCHDDCFVPPKLKNSLLARQALRLRARDNEATRN